MAEKRIGIISAAAPLDRGWTRQALEAWCTDHGLNVDRYLDRDAWHIAVMQGAPADLRGPQCHAPGTPTVVLRLGLIPKKWWE